MKKNIRLVSTILVALVGLEAAARAASLECYFDFTRYGLVPPGSTIVSNVHGKTAATVRSVGTTLNRWGLTIEAGHGASDTGVSIPSEGIAAYAGDFTVQIWFVTSETVSSNTMLFGGTTSSGTDDNLSGDSAFFVGYNHLGDKTEYIRPVVGNGTRWGTDMKAPKGTGLSVLSLHDYVVTYNSASRVMTAYMNGAQVGSMNAGGFAGLASLSEGIVVGGVRNSAFRDDSSAPVNIRSFLVYSGVLSPGQVAKLHAVGPVPGLDALGMADVVVR